MDEVNKRCTPANDGEDKHLTRDASWNRKQTCLTRCRASERLAIVVTFQTFSR